MNQPTGAQQSNRWCWCHSRDALLPLCGLAAKRSASCCCCRRRGRSAIGGTALSVIATLGVAWRRLSALLSRPSASCRQTDNASKYSGIDDGITRIIRLCRVSSLHCLIVCRPTLLQLLLHLLDRFCNAGNASQRFCGLSDNGGAIIHAEAGRTLFL